MTTIRPTVAALFLLCAATARAERLPLRVFTTADGLAHNEIRRIVRDSRGFLWFCTRDGLSRYDGYAFSNFGIEEGLPSAGVNDILETRAGVYWVATSRGLVLFDPAGAPLNRAVRERGPQSTRPMFTLVAPDADDPRRRGVNRLLEDREGTVWCATEHGLQRLARDGTRLSLRSVDFGAPDEPAQQFLVDFLQARDGSLWLATDNVIYHRLPDGRTRHYVVDPPTQGILSVFEDSRGDLWATTRAVGFYRFRLDADHDPLVVGPQYDNSNGLPANWVSGLFERSDGRMTAATTAGLIEFLDPPAAPGARFRVHSAEKGLSYPELTALAEDRAGNLWLGTGEGGAMKLARDGFITYDAADGVDGAYSLAQDAAALCLRGVVPSLARIADHRPLLREPLVLNRRYARFDGRTFDWFVPRTMTRESDLGWVNETVLVRSFTGEWWFGTGSGVLRFPAVSSCADTRASRPIAHYGLESGLASLQVFRLFEDSQGGMWVSTTSSQTSGLARWDRATNSWSDVVRTADLPHWPNEIARAFAEDRRGAVWIGYGDRVVRYRHGRFDSFTDRDGFSVGAVVAMDIDTAGRLWLASTARGLVRVDEPESDHPRFVSYTMAEGLSSDSAMVLTHDLLGRLYVGTGRGLDRFDPASGRVKHFTTTDGLAAGQFRAAYRDHAGVLWFGTTGGLSRLVPTPDLPDPPPDVLLTRLSVAGSNEPVSVLGERAISLRDLQPAENSVEVEYVGLEFAVGETVRYSYKLDGAVNAEWSAPSAERLVTFGNLAPGDYRLQIRAIDSQSLASAPAVVSFTILKPIWQRWWFVTLLLAAVAAAPVSVHRYRVRRQLELANVRARIALDLHDDIGSNLTKISILSELARQRQPGNGADDPLGAIARISRESVASMSDIVWAINPQRDRLVDLLQRMRRHVEEMCSSSGVALSFAPGPEQTVRLSVDVRRDMFLIFKEAITNIARHSRCRRVDVALETDGRSIALQVSDDGVGFDLSQPADGQGLVSMRRRAESHGGTFEIHSRPGRTTVAVRLPLSGSASLRQPT